ncbi:hypothetical protein ACIBI9_55815 [Nonomuraea sp. NPDC050451]|uniref:hypothetical protein n=1 Tax=Nonomuraea sp. NPDC050451 TaxID=3364364 RepID=UPI003793AB38
MVEGGTPSHAPVDGIHVDVRLEERKLCLLVVIGVRADGRKERVALADGDGRQLALLGASDLRDDECIEIAHVP